MTTYKDAGVDIDAAEKAKQAMKEHVDSGDSRVLNTLGAFASLVDGSFPGYTEPILVLKTEEPGSKQKLAMQHGSIRSVCFDTIHHLINDIAVMGAAPLYVQDLIACGKIDHDVVNEIVKGFADACKEQECTLTGGETTEQPGVLEEGAYVLAANIVGVVEKTNIIDGSTTTKGDVVLAVASNGLHTNGYTLVRSLLDSNTALAKQDVDGATFIEAILRPHTCYAKAIQGLVGNPAVHGMAHITGGGIQGNLSRILPQGLAAEIDLAQIRMPAVFTTIRDAGGIEDIEMLKTYNMGVGIAVVVAEQSADDIIKHFVDTGHACYRIGEIAEGDQTVRFTGMLQW